MTDATSGASSDGPGFHDGQHFTVYVETVKALKREGRLDEAIALLEHLIKATEAEAHAKGWGVAPWFYEQLAIIHAKRGEADAELAVLERYAAQAHAPGAGPARMAARLKKARTRQS